MKKTLGGIDNNKILFKKNGLLMKSLIVFIILWIVFLDCKAQTNTNNNNIVLVNMCNHNRAGIANQISLLCALNPKVISIDIEFPYGYGGEGDRNLVRALWSCRKLVMPTVIEFTLDKKISINSASATQFRPIHSKSGFVSAKAETGDVEIPKRFLIQQKDSFFGLTEYHFSISTAMTYDSLKTMSFVKNNPDSVEVDLREGNRIFKRFSASDVLSGRVTRLDIEGKIVMIGFLGPGNADKYVSPLNKKTKKPDMYGLEYLANIVAQILGW